MCRLEIPKVQKSTLKHHHSSSERQLNKAPKKKSSCYLKAKDDGPDEAQGETVITVHNVMRAHVFKVNLLLLEKLQSFVNILQAVDAHAAFGWPWL